MANEIMTIGEDGNAYIDRPHPSHGLSATSKARDSSWDTAVNEAVLGSWQWYNRRYVTVSDTPNDLLRGRSVQHNMTLEFIEARYIEMRKRIAVEMRERLDADRIALERYEMLTRELEGG